MPTRVPIIHVPRKQDVAGIGISTTSYAEVVELFNRWAEERKQSLPANARIICVTSVHGIVTAQGDPELAAILNAADIATPDGMPVVWALRSFGSRNQKRVYGPTLMVEMCRSAAEHGRRIFLYGGREETLEELAVRLRRSFPNLMLAGYYAPPFRPLSSAEDEAVCEMILKSDADIVFVGISTPKQEKWMYEHRNCFPGVTLVGVGAAFDFHAGRVRQAPGWMQRNGLEWLFRLMMEPGRLWKRYLLVTPRFLPLWAAQKWRMSFRRGDEQ